ncbi:transposase [Rhodococcus koreensis]|uniref:Transposase n=1 Tax=Rhodococcus koreensis TaxID=99653 RepID=A0A1H4KWM6_9NOCA|nr:transposase [Rhodococcus koreensis]
MSLMVMKAYLAKFKADAVTLYLSEPSHTSGCTGRDLGISSETLRKLGARRTQTGWPWLAERC